MPDFRKFCACGGERVALNVSATQIKEILESWARQHDKPGCYAVTAKTAKKARQQDFLDDIFGKDDK